MSEETVAYGVCEACGTPTPWADLDTLETPIKPLTACPACRPAGRPAGLEADHE